ncbi:uncharacterized protein LOC124121174 [Haliotis rufescens]|uniref:uncharacterized protein LOC124121174 n=1 Tax=Haliotis rufescens TaxID=6454 RepID=UPI00201FA6B5|nr:uncharacterized protein LOC124121174 [Haliotis rufescens]
MEGLIHLSILLSIAYSTCGSNVSLSIAFTSVTTDNLTNSIMFYTEILGGMLAPEFMFRYSGNQHHNMMFQKEILQARQSKVAPAVFGVPDISDNGTYEVVGAFVFLDNAVIQLLQFESKRNPGAIFNVTDRRSSPAVVPNDHMCILVKPSLNLNTYVHALETRARQLGFNSVKANRPVTVHSEAERQNVPVQNYTLPIGAADTHWQWAYLKGPSGEQIELNKLVGDYALEIGKEYCKRKAVSTMFLDKPHPDNEWKVHAGLTGQTYGLFQHGTRARSMLGSTEFYTEILGGSVGNIDGLGWNGDGNQNMLFQKEMLQAEEWHVDYQSLGIANLTSSGNMSFAIRWSYFNNYVVETVEYDTGRNYSYPKFNPTFNLSTPALINSMRITFLLPESVDMNSYLRDVEQRSAARGFPQVKGNRAVDVTTLGQQVPLEDYSVTFTDGALQGLRYSYLKGPSGEQVSFVQFTGPSSEKLKNALLRYNAVSTAFPETNPWNKGGYDEYCSQFPPFQE